MPSTGAPCQSSTQQTHQHNRGLPRHSSMYAMLCTCNGVMLVPAHVRAGAHHAERAAVPPETSATWRRTRPSSASSWTRATPGARAARCPRSPSPPSPPTGRAPFRRASRTFSGISLPLPGHARMEACFAASLSAHITQGSSLTCRRIAVIARSTCMRQTEIQTVLAPVLKCAGACWRRWRWRRCGGCSALA